MERFPPGRGWVASRMMGTMGGRFKDAGRSGGREGSPREEQVLPGLRLVGEVPQQVGRVVGDDERDAAMGMDPAPEAREARLLAREPHGGGLAQRDDDLRPDELDL